MDSAESVLFYIYDDSYGRAGILNASKNTFKSS
jgi:hypothetical protein